MAQDDKYMYAFAQVNTTSIAPQSTATSSVTSCDNDDALNSHQIQL